jgi:hypothetical protein
MRDLGAVEELNRVRPSACLRASRSDSIARPKTTEIQRILVVVGGDRLVRWVDPIVDSRHHLEQVLGSGIFMSQDENSLPESRGRPVVEPRSDVGRYAALSGFQNERADLASSLALLLKTLVDVALPSVPDERDELAGFGLDLDSDRAIRLQVVEKRFICRKLNRCPHHPARRATTLPRAC